MAINSSYYDIDAILAEEELVPCTTLFDFSHLGHLDPDARNSEHYLPEASRLKVPLWATEKWAMLGFVRLSLPNHYGRKSRERLEADPADADLRKRSERFFLGGSLLVDLIDKSSKQVAKAIAATPNWRSNRRVAHTRALEQVSGEAQDLRRTLLKTYAGERLRQTFDWSLSSGGDDDVSHYLGKLTEMEQRLFYHGSSAVAAHEQWKLFGNRRLISGITRQPTQTAGPMETSASNNNESSSSQSRPVSPGNDDNASEDRDSKRQRVQ